MPGSPGQESQQRTKTPLAEAGAGVGYLASRQRGIELVNAHRDAVFVTDALGKADVVGVPVRQDKGPNVLDRAAHGRQLTHEVAVIGWHPGVDDGDLARLLDEVAPDSFVSQAVQGRGDTHGVLLGLLVRVGAPRSRG